MEDPRDRMKAFLEELGWTVLPGGEYPEDQYRSALEKGLKESLAFVQLIGPYPWKRGGFDRIQNEAASALGHPAVSLSQLGHRSGESGREATRVSRRAGGHCGGLRGLQGAPAKSWPCSRNDGGVPRRTRKVTVTLPRTFSSRFARPTRIRCGSRSSGRFTSRRKSVSTS